MNGVIEETLGTIYRFANFIRQLRHQGTVSTNLRLLLADFFYPFRQKIKLGKIGILRKRRTVKFGYLLTVPDFKLRIFNRL